LAPSSDLASGNFGFTVNLASGAITNGDIFLHQQGTLTGWQANLQGGTGVATASGFTMTAHGVAYYNSSPQDTATAFVEGISTNLLSAPSGYSFPVFYGVTYHNTPGTPESDAGAGTGVIDIPTPR